MRYTKTGFPKVKTPHQYLTYLFKNQGYGSNFISAHFNTEKDTAHLHEIMWLLTNENYITNSYHDELFKVRLTMKGVGFVETLREVRRRNFYTVISLIISLTAIIISIIGFLRSFWLY
jgi:hypothetical protein